MIAPPRKTELGQEELRKRTRKLSQRHRTVLLLVDGKRSRIEVLTLAQQAGSAPSLFDELLAMGMVEEPSVPTVPAPLPDAEAAQAAAEPQAETRAEAQVDPPPAPQLQPVEPAADEAPVLAVEAERVEIEIAPPVTDVAAEPPAVPSAEDAVAPPPAAEPPVVAEPVMAVPFVERRLTDQPVAVERRAARARVKFAPPIYEAPAPLRVSGPVPPVGLPEAAAALPPELAPTTPLDPEQRLLGEVRNLLVGTLLIDSPVSSSLLALRVGRAKSRDELIGLVWEIEHSMARSRRPREARGRLERARDLLGLGNTLVDEDTSFGRDSQW